MPEFCAAYSCSNRRTVESKARGITFHKFPRQDMRKIWERALRRKDFTATNSTVLCSEHFKPEDFDRTGQIVRLRDGVIPSIFNFPVKPRKSEKHRMSIFRRVKETLPEAFEDDHCYALPASPTVLKARLHEALARVESLEQEKKNAMAREKRARIALQTVLEDLREKKLISDEFKERLEYYEDVFTQQLPFSKEFVFHDNQNPIQGVILEPSVTEEKLQDEQLQDLHDVEIIEFTYNSKKATTPRDDFQLSEEQEPAAPSQDVAQVSSSDTEDSEDYSKDYSEVRPSSENSQWFCKPKEGFSCQACSRTFEHRRLLFRHVTAHIRDAERVCGLCGERFGADGGLKLHLQTHTRKRKKKQDPAKTQSRQKRVQTPSRHSKNKEIQKADESNKPVVKRSRGRPRKNKQNQDNPGGTKKRKRIN